MKLWEVHLVSSNTPEKAMKNNAGLDVIFMIVNLLYFLNTKNSGVSISYLADRFEWERMKSVAQIVIKYCMLLKKEF